jgi:hypothetical protein
MGYQRYREGKVGYGYKVMVLLISWIGEGKGLLVVDPPSWGGSSLRVDLP